MVSQGEIGSWKQHSQSTKTILPTRGLMLSDKTTLSGSNAQSKYSNHWDMNHNQQFWVAKNHEVVKIKVDRHPAASSMQDIVTDCLRDSEASSSCFLNVWRYRNVLCLEILPSELEFSLQFFSSISPASVLLWQWQVFTKISRSYSNKWHDLRSDQRLHFTFLFFKQEKKS